MSNELFKLLCAVVFGLFLAVFKFPSEKLEIKLKLTTVSAFLYRFIIGLFIGLTVLPTFDATQKQLVAFVTTQPDFIVTKVYRLILGTFCILGFYIGMKAGKKKTSIK